MLFNILSNVFPATASKANGRQFSDFVYLLFYVLELHQFWNRISFFHLVGNFPFSQHNLKIQRFANRSITNFYHPNTYHGHALYLGQGFQLFSKCHNLCSKLLTVIYVFFEGTEGRSLFVFIREHCFAKKVEYFSLSFKVFDEFIIL